jgi:arylsulfatase A-like enzyme
LEATHRLILKAKATLNLWRAFDLLATLAPDNVAARRFVMLAIVGALTSACGRPSEPPQPSPVARNIVLITIDTLRADRVGSYGYGSARTPAIDALAARGTRFERAYATAPITLTSHASLMSGRYPAGHGARHNGLRVNTATPLLAEALAREGFATAAFVAAFPLDRRFGLDRGFQTYSDRLPRSAGRQANERPGDQAASEAIAWLQAHRATRGGDGRAGRYFLWIHLFEPHAPYGAAGDARPVTTRYDEEIAEADRQVGRTVEALGPDLESTTVVVAADHGEAFGEHGEIAHSIFVYDTTLRVPLVVAGPGAGRHVAASPVSLVDIAPTLAGLAGLSAFDADGVDLRPVLAGHAGPPRTLYAESFAPLLDFGWSPLRSVRRDDWKYIDAPRPELYRLSDDAGETRDLSASEAPRATAMRKRVEGYGPATLDPLATPDRDAAARLQSLGYVGGGTRNAGSRPDPKDRRELAADIARVTSGELRGRELEAILRRILASDPGNPLAQLRLGFVLQESSRCPEAVKHFTAAIDAGIPGADAHLGRAGCHAASRRFDAAASDLRAADRVEPGNPVVLANLGVVLSDGGRPKDGVPHLERSLTIDPDFHQARFNLAVAFARLGQRADAAREAGELLRRLPADAPQRREVERLLAAVR